MKNQLLLMCLVVVASITLPDCRKKEIPPPEIRVTSPTGGADIEPGNALSANITVVDPAGVNKIEYHWVKGKEKVRVGKGQVFDIQRQRELNHLAILSIPETILGVPLDEEFYLEIIAHNPETSKKRHILLNINYPISSKVSGFVGLTNAMNKDLVFCDGNSLSTIENQLGGDPEIACIGNKICYSSEARSLRIQDRQGNIYSDGELPVQDLQFLRSIDKLYAVYRDVMFTINSEGSISNTFDLGGQTEPFGLVPLKENILVLIKSRNQSTSRLRKVNRRSGKTINQQQFAHDISFGVVRNSEEALLFDTSSTGTTVMLYDETNTVSTLKNLPQKLKGAYKIGEHYFVLSTERVLYDFNPNSIDLSSMRRDVVSGSYYISEVREEARITFFTSTGDVLNINVDGALTSTVTSCPDLTNLFAIDGGE